jgi:hypothetical protein
LTNYFAARRHFSRRWTSMALERRTIRRDEFPPIGETAGAVRHMLSDGGSTTLASLIEAAGVHESLFFVAVGWIARENKITIEPCHGDCETRLK